MANRTRAQKPPAAEARAQPLTKRQREVLELVAKGLTNKEIARDLAITVATVKKHIATMMALYDAANRTALVQKALGSPRDRGQTS